MPKPTCSIPGCDGFVFCREWCRRHYSRWQRHGDPIAGRRQNGMTVEDAFRFHMPGDPPATGCWEWTANCTPAGYGTFTAEGGTRYAHITSHIIFNGPVPRGLEVRHSCHNPPCCHPAHLSVGTSLDNSRDMVEAGRVRRGAVHPFAKLTESDIPEIRRLVAEGASMSSVARRFGVSVSAVCHIIRGNTWKHV